MASNTDNNKQTMRLRTIVAIDNGAGLVNFILNSPEVLANKYKTTFEYHKRKHFFNPHRIITNDISA